MDLNVTLSKKRSLKLLATLLLSYMLILLIPIVIGSVAYFRAGKIIEEESSNSRQAMLNQVCSAIDSRLKEIQMLSMQISMDFTIQDFMSTGRTLSTTDRYKMTHVIRDLLPYRNSNHFIKDFYIYFRNSDLIVSSLGMFTPDFFYKNMHSYKGISQLEWQDKILRKSHYNFYMPVMDVTDEYWSRRVITYVQSLPIIETNNPSATLVVLIDEDDVTKDWAEGLASEGVAFIIDKNNEVILSSGNFENGSLPDYKHFREEKGMFYEKIGKRNMVVSYTTSSQTGWKYVSIIPKSVYMAKVDYIKEITITIVGACIIVGLIAAYFLSYRNYHSISRIVEILNSWLGDVSTIKSNGLNYIFEAINTAVRKNNQLELNYKQLLKENEEFKDRINSNKPMVRNGLISKLLNGRVEDFDTIIEWLRIYDVVFPYNSFAVILFHVDRYNHSSESSYEQDNSLIRFVICHVAEELSNERSKGFAADLENDTLALIINFSEQIHYLAARGEIHAITNRVKDFIYKEFNAVLTVGIGGIYQELQGIHESYGEAVKALDYKIIRGNSSTISYDEIIDRGKEYHYPIDIELQLINCVKVGDIQECENILKQVFEENFNKRRLPLKLVKCLFFDIISTVIKILDEIHINYTEVFGPDFDPVDSLTCCETVDDMHSKIREVYKQICEHINEKKVSHNVKLRQTIINYIDENYMDLCLSQTVIARELKITSSYLCKFFKQETGQNMVDYINRLRVEKAKGLLVNTELSLSDIAGQTGYNSDRVLIRNFKQHVGVTPGRYRSYS